MSVRVALVTGASSGIGRAIALELASTGCDVCVNYVTNPAAARAVVRRIERLGRRALAFRADVSGARAVTRLVRATVRTLGRLDVLVNNAGIEQPTPLLEITERNWDRVLDVDLKSAFLCAQAAARQMRAQGRGGCIINISSVHQDLPMPGNTPYVVAKGGMRMLTRNLALELADSRIRVVAVAPGAIATPMNAATLRDPEKRATLEASIPLGRIGTADEVAKLVAFVASDDASYITGTTIYVDGGLMREAGSL
jgi:glucose 1-dehydrogenase